VGALMRLVTEVRRFRSDQGLRPGQQVPARLPGIGATALAPHETAGAVVARRAAAGLAPPVFMLVPGKGALIRSEASAGAQALARCLGDVLARFSPGASPVYLTAEQCAELLDWDAEKYRLALNAR